MIWNVKWPLSDVLDGGHFCFGYDRADTVFSLMPCSAVDGLSLRQAGFAPAIPAVSLARPSCLS